MTRPVFITLGSNIDPEHNLPRAAALLNEQIGVRRTSAVYRTTPLGPDGEPLDQPYYLNAAVLVDVDESVTPEDLKFRVLRPIEENMGRVRENGRYAPRTIDLDIALFGDWVQDEPFPIPDPEILTRAHVALPLVDLDPEFVHPVEGLFLIDLAFDLLRQPGIEGTSIKLLP